ncbi:hypothetical protein LWI28_024668 [Acer negundo]|uniref:Uncharacterized protein n=1 Tax=Acer negundo TaxID=4023 RepID=A0AAD5P443_ACENE|nr:hypothetical protein LWI28_024668 [Acer negundo]
MQAPVNSFELRSCDRTPQAECRLGLRFLGKFTLCSTGPVGDFVEWRSPLSTFLSPLQLLIRSYINSSGSELVQLSEGIGIGVGVSDRDD